LLLLHGPGLECLLYYLRFVGVVEVLLALSEVCFKQVLSVDHLNIISERIRTTSWSLESLGAHCLPDLNHLCGLIVSIFVKRDALAADDLDLLVVLGILQEGQPCLLMVVHTFELLCARLALGDISPGCFLGRMETGLASSPLLDQ